MTIIRLAGATIATESKQGREDLIAFWRRLQKAALETASPNVAVTLRDAAWLYAKGYYTDAPVEPMVRFIAYVDDLELTAGARKRSPRNALKTTEGGLDSAVVAWEGSKKHIATNFLVSEIHREKNGLSRSM